MKSILCNKNPYFCTKTKRSRKSVIGTVIHYTGNSGDTAESNARYFKGNDERYAGAHIVIDQKGIIIKCANLTDICYSVGQDHRSGRKGEAHFFGNLRNANTVSIELCDIVDKAPSDKMVIALSRVLKWIDRYCPNNKYIVRHWDVNGKDCPFPMTGNGNKKWKALHDRVSRIYGKKGVEWYGI